MIANPIIEWELSGLLRTRRALAMIAGVALTFTILVLIRWPADGQADRSGIQSRQVFTIFAYGLTAAVTLLVPVFPATTIVREKLKGTLALLLNSPLHPFHIYAGKLVGVLGFSLLLLMASTPAVSACYVMGGVSLAREILPLYLVLLLVSLQYATWGLLVSTLAGSTDSAMRITYGGVLCFSVVVLAPHYFLQGMEGPAGDLPAIIRNISPLPAVMAVIGQADVAGQGLISGRNAVLDFSVLGILSTGLFAGITLSRLNFSILDRSRSQGLITDDRSTGTRVARRLFFLIDPQRRKSGILPLVNPVMVKEFRTRQFGRFHWLLRLVSVCALISLALAYATTLGSEEWGVETIGTIIVSLQVALIILFTPGIAAGLISSERESGGWDLLRTTPLSAGAIVRGKLMSVIWTLLLLLAATLPGYAVMIKIKPILQEQVEQVIICLVLSSVFAVMLSATVSCFFQRTAPATVTTYAVLIGIYAITLLIWMGRDAPFGFVTVQTALTINPMAAALSVIETPGFADYSLVPMNWWVTGSASVFLFLVLLFQTWRLTRPM